MKLYQVHNISEYVTTTVSEDQLKNGTHGSVTIAKFYVYVIAESIEDAKIKAFPSRFENEHVYALEVSANTLDGEILNCMELIEYWNAKSDEIKKKENVDAIVASQTNRIKKYKELQKSLCA